MSATKLSRRGVLRTRKSQSGTAAVEFALLAMIFFTLVFGIIEVSRLLFVMNTLHEVTRRAASVAVNVYPRDTVAIARLKQYAVFRDTPGYLILGNPATDEHVRLEYLRSNLSVIPEESWPDSAAANRQLCMVNPRAPTCIRFVQVRICDTAAVGECKQVITEMLLSLIKLPVPFHRATTIVPVESLGYVPGTLPPALPPCGC